MKNDFNSQFVFYEVGWAGGVNKPTPFFRKPTIHPEITIVYNLEGNFDLIRPEKIYSFKKNSMGIFWAMVPFMISDVSQTNASAYITIPYNDLALSTDFNRLLKKLITPEAFFHPSLSSDFEDTFIQWTKDIRSGGQTQKAAIYSIKSFLCRWDILLSYDPKFKNSTQERSPLFQKLFLYIFKNCSQKITEATISNELKIHPKSITRCFKKTTGMTLHDYVLQFRLKRAESLLIKSDLSITEIWSQAGFESSSSFYRNFKNHYDKSPDEYRHMLISKPEK